MTVISVDLDMQKIHEVKRITGAKSTEEAIDLALDALLDSYRLGPYRIAKFQR